jgi:hypothetical protein
VLIIASVSKVVRRVSTTSRKVKPSSVNRGVSIWINNERSELTLLQKDLALHEKKFATYMKELEDYPHGSAPLEQLAKDENKAIRKITRDIGTCNVRIAELERKLK